MIYADADEYLARNRPNPGTSTDDTALIGQVLDASARLIDRRLGWCPGAFAPIPQRTVRFWPRRRPQRILRLRDSEGLGWPLRDWTEISVDYTGSGTPTRTWTRDDDGDWIVALPDDATGRPHRKLRILESHRDAVESVWPCDPGYVDVTGPWGWAVTPEPIVELSVSVARQMLDAHLGGASAMVNVLDAGRQVMGGSASKLWRHVEMEYSAGRMGRLGLVSSASGSRR